MRSVDRAEANMAVIGMARPAVRMAVPLLLLGACQAPPPVDPEQWQLGAKRLLEPLLTDTDVGCGELLIEISPNYFGNVSQPRIDANLHSERKERVDDCDELIWTNKVGDLSGALSITVGADDELTDHGSIRGRGTRFTVLHQVRLRIHTGGGRTIPVRLDITATGRPLVWNEGGKMRDLSEFRLADGVLTAR